MGEPCSVVADWECKAPPAMSSGTRAWCFWCGNFVCTNDGCSKIVKYGKFGPKRLCAYCQVEFERDQERKKKR